MLSQAWDNIRCYAELSDTRRCCTDEMELTKIQDIKNTRISIRLPDILDVLKVECEALNDIQTRVCFRLKDNTYMVKPGIVAGVEDFVETLRAKDREYLKKIEQQRKKSQREANNDKSANINQTPPSQPLTANSSAGSSLALLSTDNSPSTPTKALLSINDCKQSINEFIEKWCKSHTPGILLHESNDYTLFVKESNVHLKCNCGIEMTLPFQRKTKTFQISSFYRHIKQTNCSVIKQKQNTNEQRTTNVQTKDDDQSDIATVVEDVDNSQTHHLDLKRRACFIYPNTNEYVVRPGIKYNIEYVTELLRRFQQNFDKLNNNDTNLFKTTTTCLQANEQPATLLKNLNDFVNNSREQNEHQPFLFAFLENIINNLGRSKNNYEYNEYVHRFAITLHILAGSNTYEFIRINLPGALPSVSTLEQHNKNIDLKMNECQFQFDRLKGHLDTINSNFVFLSEDCSSVVNIVRSAYGADTKLVAIDILRRWIYIYEQCKLNDIRIIGYSTDCDNGIHLGTKIRNRLLSKRVQLFMGKQSVDITHLSSLIENYSKLDHNLVRSDIFPHDRQNFSSCLKISSVDHLKINSYMTNEGNKDNSNQLTTKDVEEIVQKAYYNAKTFIDRLKMNKLLKQNNIYNLNELSNYVYKRLSQSLKTVDYSKIKNDDKNDNSSGGSSSDNSNSSSSDDEDSEIFSGSGNESENNDDNMILQSTKQQFDGIKLYDSINETNKQSFFRV
ncbi:unnamed protein product [Didymodactylos carnosus]|uniref:THAP9-like helix-turn-helix domain-containing protein n=2 Tax=Didymodactylos carnosus TaxID=1234261 RepID=A0A815CR35_9BILA|nr:unnamed protein product [Didymodactylos carnosus]CAF4089135.1 unnamed protein product [Didymodactylos carnosus]